MPGLGLPARRRRAAPEMTLEALADQPFPTSDLVLLCSFGLSLTARQTHRRLTVSLLGAGFPAALARHLIRVSPLLRPARGGGYFLRSPDC